VSTSIELHRTVSGAVLTSSLRVFAVVRDHEKQPILIYTMPARGFAGDNERSAARDRIRAQALAWSGGQPGYEIEWISRARPMLEPVR
jgi:hypothetical protein